MVERIRAGVVDWNKCRNAQANRRKKWNEYVKAKVQKAIKKFSVIES